MSQCDRKASPSAAGRRARPGTDGGRRGGSGREALGGSTPLGLQPAAHAPSAWPHSVRFCARPGFFNCLGSFSATGDSSAGDADCKGCIAVRRTKYILCLFYIIAAVSPERLLFTPPNMGLTATCHSRNLPDRPGQAKSANDSSALKPIGGASASERKTSKGTSTLGGVVHV